MGHGRGTSHASSPVVQLGTEADQKGWIIAERGFVAVLAQVVAGRAWVRETLPAACLVGDDCASVLSELLANAAEHGGGGRVSVTIEHGPGWVQGVLVEHRARTGSEPVVRAEARSEARRLLGAADQVAEVGDLLERGRGLAVVEALCRGAVETWRDGDHRITWWELPGCDCAGDGPW